MKNKILSILIVVFLILTPVQGASAHVQSGKPKNPPKARAVLRDLETGKKTELTVISKHEKKELM
jgi:translation elongation factor P/translation initiation factor 5A